ncbi:MAG: hypothetical protein WCG23_00050 [bacterium]
MDGLQSFYNASANAGSHAAIKQFLNLSTPSDRFLEETVNKLKIDKRKDLIDYSTLRTFDISMATSIKLAEMDNKLDKICQKLNVKA